MATLKHRILEMLADDGPFVLALEAGFGECLALDDWVTTGKGDPAAALRWVMTWSLETEELLELLRWMRKQNEGRAPDRQLHVQGFDVTSWGSKKALLDYLGEIDGAARADMAAALQALGTPDAEEAYAAAPATRQNAVRAGLARAAAAFAQNRARYQARKGAAAYERARAYLDGLMAAERAFSGAVGRDRVMAENILALAARQPAGRRVAVWAHNAHVSHQPGRIEDMGLRLREALGDGYVSVGFAFGEGSVLAADPKRGYQNLPIDLTNPRGLDAALGLLPGSATAFAIDLRTAQGATLAWLRSYMDAWSIGGVYFGPDAVTLSVVPALAYDAVVYVRRVGPKHLLPRAKPAAAAAH